MPSGVFCGNGKAPELSGLLYGVVSEKEIIPLRMIYPFSLIAPNIAFDAKNVWTTNA